jgi:hypothetical protein
MSSTTSRSAPAGRASSTTHATALTCGDVGRSRLNHHHRHESHTTGASQGAEEGELGGNGAREEAGVGAGPGPAAIVPEVAEHGRQQLGQVGVLECDVAPRVTWRVGVGACGGTGAGVGVREKEVEGEPGDSRGNGDGGSKAAAAWVLADSNSLT